MNKKILKIFITFILLFSIGITRVYADTPYFRDVRDTTVAGLKNSGMITYDWYAGTGGADLCANNYPGSCKTMYKYWNLYSAQIGDRHYIMYCLNPSLGIHKDGPMNQYDNLDSLKFSDPNLSQEEKNRRTEMLKRLLLFGYNPDPTNTISLQTLVNNDPQARLKLIAMQILVWEVMEGGRTDFGTVEPQYAGSNSFYKQVIEPNGDEHHPTLYYYYHKFRADALWGDQMNPAPAFNQNTYTMVWDSTNNRYTVTVPGLGDYDKCSVDNSKVSLSAVTNSTITISSNEIVNDATITCRYYRGTGPSDQTAGESFKHFDFVEQTATRQDLVYGTGWRIYSNSFKVTAEKTNLSIKKVDTDSATVSGAKFTLTNISNSANVGPIVGNGAAVEINKTGKYIVRETTVPEGYEKINDFYITINASAHKITACDNSKSDAGGNIVSCLNNQVKVSYVNDTIELKIVNTPKTFKILKVDKSNNRAINGATFQIKDSKNNILKFTKGSGNIFKYDTNGAITSLSIANASSYSVALLPAGEYKIVETAVPYPYRLPSNEETRTTKIKVNSNRDVLVYDSAKKTYVAASQGIVTIKNVTTKVILKKIGNGNSLEGVQFELYDENKEQRIKTTVDGAGVYTYQDNQSSVDNYVFVTNSKGEITINYLPEGTYYFKEIATVSPYVLPQGDGVYTKVEIKITEKGVAVNKSYTNNEIVVSNSLNSFNFYKRDENGNSLTTGKYKLQKYDKDKDKYVDLKLKPVENDGSYNPNTDIYKVDNKNGKIQFTLTKGVATFIEMEPSSTYRIVETVAPEGYTKASTNDTAIAHIDEYGNASGLLVLIDQKIVKEDDQASAELIINIQTGKQRIMYAAVIFIVIGAIVGLIIYNKRK